MLETIKEGGWLMIPIFISSVVASAIILERLWSLDAKRILPKNLLPQVWVWLKNDQLDSIKLRKLHLSSPLGHILAAGLINYKDGKQAMTQAIERAAAETIRDLECYLSTLGIIAAVCPLLGLLGTVIGMIQVFGDIMFGVSAISSSLAGGISSALITTAAGLVVAIPAYIFHRYFVRKVELLILSLETESSKLVESIYSDNTIGVAA
jgi:biopolymer transport protein ExbB